MRGGCGPGAGTQRLKERRASSWAGLHLDTPLALGPRRRRPNRVAGQPSCSRALACCEHAPSAGQCSRGHLTAAAARAFHAHGISHGLARGPAAHAAQRFSRALPPGCPRWACRAKDEAIKALQAKLSEAAAKSTQLTAKQQELENQLAESKAQRQQDRELAAGLMKDYEDENHTVSGSRRAAAPARRRHPTLAHAAHSACDSLPMTRMRITL